MSTILALFGGMVLGMSIVGFGLVAVTGRPGWIQGLAVGCVIAGAGLCVLGKLMEDAPDDQAYT